MGPTDVGAGTESVAYTGEQPITTVIALELADALDQPPTESPPLANSIDTDALDRLFRNSDADIELTFSHADRRIFVSEAGVTVKPIR